MINVFDIERYATKDGPGIRTVLFLKGCNLRCSWCQNPESWSFKKQLMYYKNKCSGCGKCIEVCPEGAVFLSEKYGFITDHDACTGCGRCADACFFDARRVVGQDYDIEQLMKVVLADRHFYRESGGGVTFSGGEPLLQHREVREIAERCRAEGIHTAIETAAAVDWQVIEGLLDVIDLFYVDLKHIDNAEHLKYTGVGMEKILANITEISRCHDNVVVRIPVIPGVNHSEKTVKHMLDFIYLETAIRKVELLPFHRLGSGKYDGLGFEYPWAYFSNVEKTECAGYTDYGRMLGLDIGIGAV